MRTRNLRTTIAAAVRVGSILLSGAVLAFGQQQVNLTAGSTSMTLPDGTVVPMWGYTCGAAVGGSTATCGSFTRPTTTPATTWSPVVITVPSGQALTINLTNSLSFAAGTGTNGVPTSLVIVGQLGGGLGDVTQRTTTPSPDHTNAQGATTWPIAGGAGVTAPAQGPRVQSFSTEVPAGGAPVALTFGTPTNPLRPGTYLLESGTHPSIQGPMGLYGIVVVTTAPAGTTAGTAYPNVGYDAEVPLVFSEIDPVQNNAVQAAVTTAGFSETMVWSGQPGGCGNPSSPTYHQCYPPAVNYTALYDLINGVAFDKTNAALSSFPVTPATGLTAGTGRVLVRMVNAGLRMHVPSIVGAQTGASGLPGFALIAEDGNPLPGVPRVQSEVFMAAGKTYDVLLNAPAAAATALPVFDRELSLSGNATARDAGMLAYISVNGAGLPAASAFGAAVARNDNYSSVVAGQTLAISDPSKGVIANDTNVYGVKVSTAPSKGTLVLNADGTFTYTPNAGWTSPDTFVYQANGSGPTATVTLSSAPIETATGITLVNDAYASNLAQSLKIAPPGILANDRDAAGYPLTVASSTATSGGLTVTTDPNGGFNASIASACTVPAPTG